MPCRRLGHNDVATLNFLVENLLTVLVKHPHYPALIAKQKEAILIRSKGPVRVVPETTIQRLLRRTQGRSLHRGNRKKETRAGFSTYAKLLLPSLTCEEGQLFR